jgi:hypothetical protein
LQPNSPELISQEEEPFKIEIVVPENKEAEEPEQQQGKNDEGDDDEEYSPLSALENEKL